LLVYSWFYRSLLEREPSVIMSVGWRHLW
jgi:hypothetical protein